MKKPVNVITSHENVLRFVNLRGEEMMPVNILLSTKESKTRETFSHIETH